MPKALKWGITIAACMILLYVIGVFCDHIGEFVGSFLYPSAIEQEMSDSFSEETEAAKPWEAEIHAADADENKGVE